MSSEHDTVSAQITMDSRDCAIEVTGVSKAYHLYAHPEDRLKQFLFGRWKTFHKDFFALENISFEVKKGEAVALIGRNGAGKSTLLQIVTSILQPTSGSVSVNGRIAPLLQLGTSFNPEYTGIENIDLSASILGLTTDEIDRVREEIIAFAELGEFIHQPVRSYSSGMFARLAFAVAAHVQAEILIVDEVLSVGDIGFTQKCTRFLREFRERGTLLFVSHDVGAVLSMCDRALWIDKGRLVEDATPKRVIPHYSTWIANPDRVDAVEFMQGIREKTIDDPADGVMDAASTPALQPQELQPDSGRAAPLGVPDVHATFSSFDWNSRSVGLREGSIVDAWWENEAGERTALLAGGDLVTLNVTCETAARLDDIIVGFSMIDRLGMVILAWDTSKEIDLVGRGFQKGKRFSARFRFIFPYIAGGAYTLRFALASGTADANRQQHWIYDPMTCHVSASRIVQGLIGVRMSGVELVEDIS